MTLLAKHCVNYRDFIRDVRPASVRIKEYWNQTDKLTIVSALVIALLIAVSGVAVWWDIVLILMALYARSVLVTTPFELPLKLPKHAAPVPDPHNPIPGKGGAGKAEGILYLGNLDESDHPDHGRELWLTNTDSRTHILFLGTTGSGKTEGLKSLVVNALTWGSGFVYVDGKADTDLWASLYALARRFGREDDLLVLNYMTANSDNGAVSNTMNPFSNGSASFITNMVVSLMPDAGGDNAMWKERAVALMGALMPALTWKRDRGELLLDVSALRDNIELSAIIRLSRDPNLPERILRGLKGYLTTLPGYIDAAFDDEGNERPPSPDQPMYDLQVARQQHGYLSMQFTRSLQSLADDYGYIFRAQLADVDVLDVVLNRRILIGLIPSLEKSGDEAANLGKIVVASLKGMMGATLGNTVEGSWEGAIGSKQTRSQSSFMTVFDEVGYYTAPGMAVMAAQARSLGFSLIFAAQDLPSMEKRVKQEAQSILANCNLKIFGKLEDPIDTKKFLSDHAGDMFVMDASGMQAKVDTVSGLFMNKPFYDSYQSTGLQVRPRVVYDHLRAQREGEVHMFFAQYLVRARMFFALPDKAQALRVQKLLPIPAITDPLKNRERIISEVATRLNDPEWSAAGATASPAPPPEIGHLAKAMADAMRGGKTGLEAAAAAIGGLPKVATAAPSRLFDGDAVSSAARAPQKTAPEKQNGAPPAQEKNMGIMGGNIAMPWSMPAQQAPVQQEEVSVDLGAAAGGFVPHDLDTSVVPRVDVEADGEDVTKLKLPEDIASYIESMAGKLNEGLGGADKAKKTD